MNARRVVLVMPVYNEARHLRRVLESISAQDFDRERLYFVGVDGASTDESAAILKEWLARGDVAGCVVSNPRRLIPIALNLGLRHATDSDIVVRLDAHSIYGPRYLTQALSALESAPEDVACIGGSHVPLGGGTFRQRVVAALYTNPMGLGGADFRFGSGVREVEQVYLGVWRPGVLHRAGFFNEELPANEDGEMSARIRRMGYRLLRVPLPCRFIVNRGPYGTLRQWHRYGYWRAKMLQCNPDFIRKRHVIVPTALLLAAGLALSPWRALLLPWFGLYAMLVYRYRAKDEPLAVTLATTLYFPALQTAFGIGLLGGLISGSGKIRRARDAAVAAAD